MNAPVTLKSLLAEHPEWGDLPLVVYHPSSGHYDWVGAAGAVYPGETRDPEDSEDLTQVLVFSPN